MSMMKTRAIGRVLGGAMGLASAAAAAITNAVAPKDPNALPPSRPVRKRKPAKVRRMLHWSRESRYTPHQGRREQTRRVRQILRGWHTVYTPAPVEEATAPAIKASALIENGLEAEKRAKRSEAARKAARTRAARKEAANG
jgi:hypothetical protein